MARGFISAILAGAVAAASGTFAGCGSSPVQPPDASPQDADFDPCEDTPAVDYMPGMFVTSLSGAYLVTLVSAKTEFTDGTPTVDHPEVGLGIWDLAVTDAATGAPAAVTLTAERPTMPRHTHGASTYPLVTPGDTGMFTLSKIDFFMPGYWEQRVNLQPASGTADRAAFAICVP
jgi:hypothetical protein